MHPIALALLLMLGPRTHPGPEGVIERGPEVPRTPAAADRWLRGSSTLRVRADTRFVGRRIDLGHGGWLLLLREHYRGHPIAGARLALRVDPRGRLRQVVGTSLDPGLQPNAPSEWPSRAQLWWPTNAGLIPARVELSELKFVAGVPTQTRRWVHAVTGELLASESTIDEILVPIRGWPENPLTTPELATYDVTLDDLDPIVLQDAVFRVLQCNWDEVEEGCDSIVSPTASEPDGFPSTPPAIEDAVAHRAWDDPYAALQFMQYAARVEAKLAQWGWDAYAWDVLDCSWQQTADPSECRVYVHTNVLDQDRGGVFPYAGAFYTNAGVIYMGQGHNADTAYDGDIVVHEIGHHVTWSFGNPEPTEPVYDASRLITDFAALNEASSDFLAWMLGSNDRIYDYFCTIEPGPYDGEQIRDVSIPFRCPQNVVGEVHMDGRIWVSAVVDGLRALADAGLADADAYAITYYGALAAIRHIPREQKVQLPDARAILLDEIELSFGAEARTIVREIFDARGVGRCDYLIDLRDEPSITGIGDPASEALHARFLVVRSYLPTADPERVSSHPYAPAVQHRVTLGPGEVGVALSYRPDRWRPPHPVADIELVAAALVKQGDRAVVFARDDEFEVVNDAELRFESVPDGERERLVIDGLEPGQTYTIALVSLSTIAGDKLMMNDMSWELLGAGDPGDGDGDTSGDTDGDTDGAATDESGTDPELALDDAGCGCTSTDGDPSPAWLLALLTLLSPAGTRRSRAGRGQ